MVLIRELDKLKGKELGAAVYPNASRWWLSLMMIMVIMKIIMMFIFDDEKHKCSGDDNEQKRFTIRMCKIKSYLAFMVMIKSDHDCNPG